MADYCNKCSEEIHGGKVPPEIDVYEIASGLCNGCIANVLCEGCEMMGVLKDERGRIFALYEEYSKDGVEIKKVSVDEWKKSKGINSYDESALRTLVGIEGKSSLGENVVKIVVGREGDRDMYHVVVEDSATGENRYSYLSNQEIQQKFGIDSQSKLK